MSRRVNFHEELKGIQGVKAVYFQPPPSIKLVYPCIIYKLSRIDIKRGDNSAYKRDKGYDVTVIDPDPDTDIPDLLIDKFPHIRFSRYIARENLNHYYLQIVY